MSFSKCLPMNLHISASFGKCVIPGILMKTRSDCKCSQYLFVPVIREIRKEQRDFEKASSLSINQANKARVLRLGRSTPKSAEICNWITPFVCRKIVTLLFGNREVFRLVCCIIISFLWTFPLPPMAETLLLLLTNFRLNSFWWILLSVVVCGVDYLPDLNLSRLKVIKPFRKPERSAAGSPAPL